MNKLACSLALLSILQFPVAQAAGPAAAKTTVSPLVLVDATGKMVGRVVDFNLVVATINSQQIPFYTTYATDAGGRYDATRAVPSSFSSVMFSTANCSGPAYLSSNASLIMGAVQTAGVVTPSGAFVYVASGSVIAPVQILSVFNSLGICDPTNYTIPVVLAGTPINLNTLFTPPYRLQ